MNKFLDYPLLKLAGGSITPGSIALALAIIIVSVAAAGLVARSVRRLLAYRGLSVGAQHAISKILRYTLIGLGVVIAIDSMGINLDALFAASAVLAVGIGFGLQSIAQNFVSGVVLLIEQPVRQGDFVKVQNVLGLIDDIGLRATRIITRDEVTLIVPNSQLVNEEVVNLSRPTTNLRVHVTVGVAYGTDVEKIREILLEIGQAHPQALKQPTPEVRFEDFGASSLDFGLLVWVADPFEEGLRIASDLRFAIEARFREHGIEIPFPQQDLHIRSGIEKLLPEPNVVRKSATP